MSKKTETVRKKLVTVTKINVTKIFNLISIFEKLVYKKYEKNIHI